MSCTGVFCAPPDGGSPAGEPPEGGLYDCDLDSVFGLVSTNPSFPTETWCGGWHEVWGVRTPGGAVQCVRLEFCLPLDCDPGYAGACPWDFVCSATTRQCEQPTVLVGR